MRDMFGPKKEGHPSLGKPCPACDVPFKVGDMTTLVILGPGADEDEQLKCWNKKPYNAVSIEIHWSCSTKDGH